LKPGDTPKAPKKPWGKAPGGFTQHWGTHTRPNLGEKIDPQKGKKRGFKPPRKEDGGNGEINENGDFTAIHNTVRKNGSFKKRPLKYQTQ